PPSVRWIDFTQPIPNADPSAVSYLTIVTLEAPPVILAKDIVVALPPDFPIFIADIPQPTLPDTTSPASPVLTATELEPSSDGVTAGGLPLAGRSLIRRGAVVLDSDIHPDLLPNPRAQALSPAPTPNRSRSPEASPAPVSAAAASGNAFDDDDEEETKEVVAKPKDWGETCSLARIGVQLIDPVHPFILTADPLATLAFLKYSRAHISDLTKRTNHFKKTFFKMRRDVRLFHFLSGRQILRSRAERSGDHIGQADHLVSSQAMALEIQTGAYVGLFICKSHKNRDDDQHAYNFHFSDTLIHNLVLVDLARTLKRDIKAHMLAIWASGVGQGESDLIIQQRKQLADANLMAGTLRAQAAVATQRSEGQEKALKKQGKQIKRQKQKAAELAERLRALGAMDVSSDDSASDSGSDSDDDSDGPASE
ncbi:hypothetical protein P7C70_g9383, partial [Phenoliferia sp. Uapishka_3]